MSGLPTVATLSLAPDDGVTHLDRLTCPNPSADDLRARAIFWRRYAFQEASRIGSDQSRRILSNCDEMNRAADQMDRSDSAPEPVPTAKAVVRKPRVVAVRHAARVDAPTFWSLHAEAVRAITMACGPSWRNDAPDETVEISVPTRLRSYTGPLGGRITWRRDWRMPAPRYWPGGYLPVGVEATPSAPRYTGPMGDDHPSMVRVRLAMAEQIVRDRLLREDAKGEWARTSMPAMLTRNEAMREDHRSLMQEYPS